MNSSSGAEADLRTRTRQQEVIADLSQRSLETENISQLLHDASVAVADALDNDYCMVLELLPDSDEAVLREGLGWREGLVGSATVSTDTDSQVGYTIHREEPVVVDDLRTDGRFSGLEILTDHEVVSGVSACIGSDTSPWGVLGTYTTDEREFTKHDADFVRSVANILASAIESNRTKSEFEEIYGRISDGFFALDKEWRFTYVNERAHELLDSEERTLVGKNIWDEFPEAVDRRFKSEYETAMFQQETVSFEEYYPEPLDEWFEVRAYPSETGLSVYFRDVTDRRERERELQRQERRFEAIFEDPNILVGLLEPDGTVLDINQTAMEYIDADLEEVLGETFWETPWWGRGDEVRRDVREWTERAADGEYVDFEADLTRPGGQRYTLNGVFRPVTNDEGDVVSVIVSDRDVTERKERERALEQSEQRYRTLAEAFPNGVVTLFDEDLRYTLAAGQAFENLPVSPDDVEGRPPHEAWGEELADELEPVLRAALDGEESSIEFSYEGREWVIYTVPITDENGEVFAGMTMAQDITERKEREAELELFRSLIDHSNDAVFVIDPDTGRFLDVNETACSRLEYDRDDLLELTVQDVEKTIPDEKAWQNHAESVRGEGTMTFEGVHQRADGTGIPVEVNVTYVALDQEYMLAVARDITERREYERQLEESERRYRTLAENFPNGAVSIYDEDLRIELTQGAVLGEKLPSRDQLEGRTTAEIYPESIVDDLDPLLRAAVEDGETGKDTFEFGGRVWRVWATPLRDADDEIFAGLSFAQDITEQVEHEQQLEEAVERLEEQNERLESFASMLAHELRNPVTIGQIYSQQLPAETDSEAVEYVTEAFDRIEDMIDVMLVLTRGRKAVGESSPIDLADVARDAWDDIDAPDAALDVELERTIQADETYIWHLFRNLLENAMEHGGDDVTVTVGKLSDGFYVADDGEGIPAEKRNAVFDQGYTTAADSGGTGLGLALVQKLAEVYEWEYAVTESAAGGARFEFRNIAEGSGRRQ